MVTEIQSRVVRDATLKRIKQAWEKFESQVAQDFETFNFDSPEVVCSTIDTLYESLENQGIAAFKYISRFEGEPSNDFGFVGEWFSSDSWLFGSVYMVSIRDQIELEHLGGIKVARHAIERLSQRLATVKPQAIRDELSPAFAQLSICATLVKDADEWMARTPNGIAVFAGGDIVTWISWDTASAWRKENWENMADTLDKSSRSNPIPVLTVAGGASVYLPRVTKYAQK